MSFSYTLGTDIGNLRLLISDTESTSALFSDEELQVFLTDAQNDKYFAAYLVFHAIIRSKVLLAKRIKREGYESEQFAVDAMKQIADSLKDQSSALTGVQTGTILGTDEYLDHYRPTWRDSFTPEMR